MTHVKICGLTNLEDAQAALDAGADMLGFNFYRPSPRYITPDLAAQIITALRASYGTDSFRCVGVFVNSSHNEVTDSQNQCALDLLQMSGDELPEYMERAGTSAFKALRPATPDAAAADIERYGRVEGACKPRFLLDASHPSLYGGTGKIGDWSLAREVARRYPILLAGGLSPANVAEAIAMVQPWGVDVASGVERAPGLKDKDKMIQFVQQAKAR